MKYLITFIICFSLLFGACEKDETENRPPTNPAVTATLLSVNPFTYEFTAQATDPEFDPLSYTWNFGEGTEKEGTARETFAYAEEHKNYTVTVTIADGKGGSTEASVMVNTHISAVTIDNNTTYQTIEGFGGFGSQRPWWEGDVPFHDAAFVDMLINDLGITILRDNVVPSFEIENDNDDPMVTNWEAFNINGDFPDHDSNIGQHIGYLKAMQEAGLQKLILSVWSPPAWMKHNQSLNNGTDKNSAPPYSTSPDENTNQLKVENYDEFAEFLVAYIQYIEQETGLDVYAISPQNEPVFSQFYASSVYSPEALRDVIKVIGARFEQEGLATKIFAPEDVFYYPRVEEFVQTMLDDHEAKQYVDIIATHNYELDGVQANNVGPTNWRDTYQLATAGDKQLWMTETSGFEDGWEGAFDLGLSIYNALKFGKVNAWVYWQMSDGGDKALIQNNQPTKRYYTSKQYYKYIRPGYVMTESSADNENMLVLSFKNEGSQTIILINLSSDRQAVHLSGEGLPTTFEVFTSSNNKSFENMGDVIADEAILLDAKSITTLYAQP